MSGIQAQTTPTNPEGTRQMALEMGLNDAEYDMVREILGRTPTLTEVGMFSVMWSEHCGYKYSRPVLRLISNYRQMADEGTMENAGVIPLGEGGLGVVFKMESHNHPSAVEPVQGAATGVGGILRDIFTMGARPIASLNSLRFGPLSDPRTKFLFRGVVEGIAFYGNCVGVPTVGGEVYFHPAYAGNPLVNAMAIGIVEEGNIARATASGVGNPVLLVGARTGRDGIHGATFASVELTEESEAKRSNVQCGDPFTEKLLIEATLEALATGHVTGIQDFGAAGLTCSTCETTAKAGTGMWIDVLKVPRRETGMTPYEVMLSESQERMLAIVEKGKEHEVAGLFHKWGLNAEIIGEVTDDGMVTVKEGETVIAHVPADWLADRCPTYTLETHEPEYIAELRDADLSVPEPAELNDALLLILSHPSIASKRWVYRQYDHQVQTNTVIVPGAADATVLRVRGTKKGIAATTDCNARWCYLDPYAGAQAAVAEAARNLACVGARPAGVTDCLNFGNPQKPEAFWQFREAVKGMAEICDTWGIPIVSGNVSFYNETPEGAILPTPTIGMVGIMDDVEKRVTMGFQRAGDIILTVGRPARGTADELGGSEYLATIHGTEAGRPPAVDMEAEAALRETLLEGIANGHIVSAHDISDGGYAVALAECCMVNGLGCEVVCGTDDRRDAAVFAENGGRAIVSCRTEYAATQLIEIGQAHGCPVALAGWVKGNHLRIGFDRDVIPIDIPVYDCWNAWENAIPNTMSEDTEGAAEVNALVESNQPIV